MLRDTAPVHKVDVADFLVILRKKRTKFYHIHFTGDTLYLMIFY